jgi:hypothetical protein
MERPLALGVASLVERIRGHMAQPVVGRMPEHKVLAWVVVEP